MTIPNTSGTMTVYETDQWTSAEVVRQKLTLSDLQRSGNEVHGGDADSVRIIFGGGRVREREIKPSQGPSRAKVWFAADGQGNLTLYKANYDSSD